MCFYTLTDKINNHTNILYLIDIINFNGEIKFRTMEKSDRYF